MTPQALKASILQLAIQGKLVPQRPSRFHPTPYRQTTHVKIFTRNETSPSLPPQQSSHPACREREQVGNIPHFFAKATP